MADDRAPQDSPTVGLPPSVSPSPPPATITKPQSSGVSAGLALVGSVITTISNFGIALLVARAGATHAGIFFASTAVVTILGNSAGLGTMTGLVYFMPRAMAGTTPNPRALIRIAAQPVIVVSALVGALLYLGASPVAELIADESVASVTTMLRVLAVGVPAWALTVLLLGATRGLGSMTPTVAVNQVFKPLAQLLAVGGIVLVDPTPSGLALGLAWGVPVVVSAGAALGAVWHLGGFAGSGPGSISAADYWRYTRPRSVSATFQIALERIDVILVSALAGESTAGVYATISRYITAGNFLIFSIAQSAAPALRRALAADRRGQAQRLLGQATGWMVLLAWPYFLLVAVEAETLASLMNPSFTTGAGALTILALGMLANAAAGPIDLTLLMLGRSGWSLVGTAAAIVTDVALALVLIPRYGIIGAAIAWALAVVVQNGLASALVYRIGDLRAAGRGAIVAATGAMLAVVPVGLVTPAGFTGLMMTGMAAAVIYIAWLIRFAPLLDLPPLPASIAARIGSASPTSDPPPSHTARAGSATTPPERSTSEGARVGSAATTEPD